MEKVKNFLATVLLFILFAIYRIGMLPWITDSVMTFTNWNMHSTRNDFVKSLSAVLFVLVWCLIGLFWSILAVLAMFLLNWLVFLIWQRFYGLKRG